mgnify:FL=1
MGANTKIEWATHTANAWIGCTKVSPACDYCYAERGSKRMGVEWGDQAERRMTNWLSLANNVRKWDRAAQAAGERHRVFWNSYSDFLEKRPELIDRRMLACALMQDTPYLDHLILTKRPENALDLLPPLWQDGSIWPKNVWLGTTAENQEQADKRVPLLLQTPAAVRFISAEPLLGPIDLTPFIPIPDGPAHIKRVFPPSLDWVIVGGESGPGARPMHPDWARSLRDQCQAAGVPFFFKQWGEWASDQMLESGRGDTSRSRQVAGDGLCDSVWMTRFGKKAAGRLLDGRTWDEFPKVPRDER